MRPSAVRTTVVLRDTAAGAITSPATLAVHTTLPFTSMATTSPFIVPAITMPSPASTPPEKRFFSSTLSTGRPLSSSRIDSCPSAAIA